MSSAEQTSLPVSLCRALVMSHYPFNRIELGMYASQFDWVAVCENENVEWSLDVLGDYANSLDWVMISGNKGLSWSEDLIERYKNRWDWRQLSGNPALPWSPEIIDRFVDRWDWDVLANNDAIVWTWDRVRRLTPKPLSWCDVPGLRGIKITPAIVPELPPICFESLSRWEASDFWTAEIVGLYADLWRWDALSGNIALPWSPDFIGRFHILLDLHLVAYLLAQPWCPEAMAQFGHTPDSLLAAHETASVLADKSRRDHTGLCILQTLLSFENRIVWTDDYFDKNGEDFCEPALLENPALPWSKDFLYRTDDYWDWNTLSCCRHVAWDPELVLHAVARIQNDQIGCIETFYNLSRNPKVWNALEGWADLTPETFLAC